MNEKTKKFIISNIPFFIVFYFFNKLGWLFTQTNSNVNTTMRIVAVIKYMDKAFKNPLPSVHPIAIITGVAFALIFKLFFYIKSKDKKKFRHGVEYGSARWGTKEDIAPLMDTEDKWNNIILADGVALRLNGRVAPKYQRNKNVEIIGGPGSGKTRFIIKPNLMQMNSSYVVTDPKGTVINECGKLLERGVPIKKVKTDKKGRPMSNKKGEPIYEKDKKGKYVYERDKNGKIKRDNYKIKIFNTKDFGLSNHYNPFAYIRKEKDILTLVNTLVMNTTGKGDKAGEDFWVKAEKLLYQALIGLIWYEAPEEEKNFRTLLEFINASEVREDDETFKNAVDMIFDDLEARNPNHYAVRQYKKYKLAAGKTAKSILISCGARLAPFDFEELLELTDYDELDLDSIGEEKTALFVITSDTDTTFNFLAAIMYTQLFNVLTDCADLKHGGRLPIHVRFLLDEFANLGRIPDIEHLITTLRSREMSLMIVLQSKAQLKSAYKDDADTIEDACDTMVFLGGKSATTTKDISENLGKETIDLFTTSDTRGTSQSYGQNFQKTGKDLMSRDEVGRMERDECIVEISGLHPFKPKKYDIESHPYYTKLSDYDSKNYFDIATFLNGGLSQEKIDKAIAEGNVVTEELVIDISDELNALAQEKLKAQQEQTENEEESTSEDEENPNVSDDVESEENTTTDDNDEGFIPNEDDLNMYQAM